MSSLNKLANMLVESLNQMQQQMQQMKGKGKACMNPKSSGGDGMKKISQEQQKLNEKMQQMMDQKGKGEGKGKEMQDLAKQQEELRKRLKESLQKMKEAGEGGMGDMDKVQKDMQETEEELKRMELTAETLMRQQRILSRMLDFDKSMRERELDEKRKGTTAQDKEKKTPATLTEPEIKDRLRKELYNSKQYQYSRLYKSLIEDYFNIMER
jgi:chromosome segregation ATPase